MVDCFCDPHPNGVEYVQFLGNVFGECLYKEMSVQWMPFIFGMASTLVWIFALAPQIYANFRNKTTEALSPIFMTIWLAGDMLTFAGSIIGGQRVTMTVCGFYFCFNDALMLSQRWYYSRRNINASKSQKAAIALSAFVLISGGVAGFSAMGTSSASSRTLLGLEGPKRCDADDINNARFVIGSIISWIAGSLYFVSRIPQILHMFKRRSVEGLDIRMFILCIVANVCGGLQFIFSAALQHQNNEFKLGRWSAMTLPFVIGSIGTLVFDFVIISMFVAFQAERTVAKDVERQ